MIGKVKSTKEAKSLSSSPTIVILPLSPNHGVFGGDGLYSESKASLVHSFYLFGTYFPLGNSVQ